MNIVVPVRLVPDLVEELSIDSSGAALDTSWLRLIISEFDDHAIEQAMLLKEAVGGNVTVISADADGVDDVLFTAAAKDADRLIKITGLGEQSPTSHGLANALAPIVAELAPDLVLTGVQTHSDLDGAVGPLLAEKLALPYVGYVAGVTLDSGKAVARKEHPGGLIALMDVALPAVLGVQAASQPPRYVAVSKVRQAMRSASIEERAATGADAIGATAATAMRQPDSAGHAAMIEGSDSEVADRLVSIFRDLGVL